VRDGQRTVAADDDQRVELELVVHLDAACRVILGPARRLDRIKERVASVGGTENGAADAKNAGDVFRLESPPAVGLDEAVEAVLQSDDFAVAVGAGLDDRADHGVEPGRITAAGEDTDTSN
jgi:hypothetical protein